MFEFIVSSEGYSTQSSFRKARYQCRIGGNMAFPQTLRLLGLCDPSDSSSPSSTSRLHLCPGEACSSPAVDLVSRACRASSLTKHPALASENRLDLGEQPQGIGSSQLSQHVHLGRFLR